MCQQETEVSRTELFSGTGEGSHSNIYREDGEKMCIYVAQGKGNPDAYQKD